MEGEEQFTYDQIYQVYQKERKTALLSKVDKEFYDRVATLMRELKDDYARTNQENPTSTKTMLLWDEIQKLRSLIREIYEYRIRKITLLALTAAAEGERESDVDSKHMVGKEKGLFNDLLEILKEGHEEIVRVEEGMVTIPATGAEGTSRSVEGETTDGGSSKIKGDKDQRGRDKTPAVSADRKDGGEEVGEGKIPGEAGKRENGKHDGEEDGKEGKKKELVAVQILEDIPKFMGEGGEVYLLKKKDFANLPLNMAKRLEDMGKAKIMPS